MTVGERGNSTVGVAPSESRSLSPEQCGALALAVGMAATGGFEALAAILGDKPREKIEAALKRAAYEPMEMDPSAIWSIEVNLFNRLEPRAVVRIVVYPGIKVSFFFDPVEGVTIISKN